MQLAADIALYHHERYDGQGYPRGISGKEIPLPARMMAILDVYDAMTHKRIYKEAICHEDSMAYIIRERGRHFDPHLVDLVKKEESILLLPEYEDGPAEDFKFTWEGQSHKKRGS